MSKPLIDQPLLSIVIPCLNEAASIQSCLRQLTDLGKRGAQLIVVDGGSSDKTVELARPLADKVVTAERGRATQMNAGARIADGKWLLFLHSDTQLPVDVDRWLATLEQVDSGWGFFPLRLSGRQWFFRLIERAICWRSRFTAIATGDQCLFVQRRLFEQLGGFSDIPLMEDVELCGRLRALSKPWLWSAPVQTSSRRWEKNGVVKTVLLMWFLRAAFFMGVNPSRLHRWYYGRSAAPGSHCRG